MAARAAGDRASDPAAFVSAAGRRIAVRVRRNPRARRIILRIAGDAESAIVTLPPRADTAEAIAVAQRHADWICARIAATPPRVPFECGAVVPFRGEPTTIRHCVGQRAGARLNDRWIDVGGDRRELPSRVARFLKTNAREDARALAVEKAAVIGASLGTVRVREMRSRWGSCSSAGDVSLSWRLILAPATVLDYVVAHEVAHLVVRRHDRAFWALADSLSRDIAAARAWLRAEGASLLRYG